MSYKTDKYKYYYLLEEWYFDIKPKKAHRKHVHKKARAKYKQELIKAKKKDYIDG